MSAADDYKCNDSTYPSPISLLETVCGQEFVKIIIDDFPDNDFSSMLQDLGDNVAMDFHNSLQTIAFGAVPVPDVVMSIKTEPTEMMLNSSTATEMMLNSSTNNQDQEVTNQNPESSIRQQIHQPRPRQRMSTNWYNS